MTPNEAHHRRKAVEAIQEIIRHKRWIAEDTGWTHPEQLACWKNEVSFQIGLAEMAFRGIRAAQEQQREAA